MNTQAICKAIANYRHKTIQQKNSPESFWGFTDCVVSVPVPAQEQWFSFSCKFAYVRRRWICEASPIPEVHPLFDVLSLSGYCHAGLYRHQCPPSVMSEEVNSDPCPYTDRCAFWHAQNPSSLVNLDPTASAQDFHVIDFIMHFWHVSTS